jgi:hypothetical protein
MSLVSVVCCQVDVSATGWSLVQRSPTECGVSISVIVKRRKMTRPRPPRGCRAIGKKSLCMYGKERKQKPNFERSCLGERECQVLILHVDATQSVRLLMLFYSVFNESSNCSV